jgi:hypothetical protein
MKRQKSFLWEKIIKRIIMEDEKFYIDFFFSRAFRELVVCEKE